MQDAFAALMFSEVDFESEPWTWLSADAKDFVSRLLVKDPSKRVTAMEALQHRQAVSCSWQNLSTLSVGNLGKGLITGAQAFLSDAHRGAEHNPQWDWCRAYVLCMMWVGACIRECQLH